MHDFRKTNLGKSTEKTGFRIETVFQVSFKSVYTQCSYTSGIFLE